MSRSAPSPSPAPRRALSARLLLTIVVMGALGMGLGALAGSLAKSSGRDVLGVEHTSLAVIGAVVFASLWTVLLVHELGHLVAGLVQGNRFMLLAAGPLLVRRVDGVVRVQFNRTAALWGGVAATIPVAAVGEALRRNLLRVVLWGPLSSLLLTIACAALMPLATGAGRLYFAVTAIASFGILLATTVPASTGHFYTDGARIRMLRANTEASERWCTVTALAALTSAGTPAGEWSPALLARAEQLADASLDGIMLHVMLYEHAFNVGDDTRAASHMASVRIARPALAPSLQSYVTLESAYWAAVGEGDAALARSEFMAAAESPFGSPIARVRTEGAVLLSEGQRDAGLAQLAAAEALAKASPDPAMHLEHHRIGRARALAETSAAVS